MAAEEKRAEVLAVGGRVEQRAPLLATVYSQGDSLRSSTHILSMQSNSTDLEGLVSLGRRRPGDSASSGSTECLPGEPVGTSASYKYT